MDKNSGPLEYSILNLTWLIAVNNNPLLIEKLDPLYFSNDGMLSTLFELKANLVGIDADVLFIGGTKLIPLNDYILSKTSKQLESVIEKEIEYLSVIGQLEKTLKGSIISYNQITFEELDLIIPSNLSLIERKHNQIEFYVVPMFVVLSGKERELWAARLTALFQSNTSKLTKTINIFKTTAIFKELTEIIMPGKIALTPLLGQRDLFAGMRTVVKTYRSLKGLG